MLRMREQSPDFSPHVTVSSITRYDIIKQAEICLYLFIFLKDKCVCYHLGLEMACIYLKESIQCRITAIELPYL